MPNFERDGVRLHYEVHGAGARTVLLITGLGFGTWSWYRQVPALEKEFRVLLLDNRGAGKSDKPDVPYSIAGMADDAAALLEHVGAKRVGVFGISMGGYISQELALRHPGRVEALVLGCTSFGGRNCVPMSTQVAADMRRHAAAGWDDPSLEEALRFHFSERYIREHRDVIDDYLVRRRRWLPPRDSWLRQITACVEHDCEARLGSLDVPTLVLAGADDPMVPAKNAELLAARIPGAKSHVFPGARHVFFMEVADEMNAMLITFFERHLQGRG